MLQVLIRRRCPFRRRIGAQLVRRLQPKGDGEVEVIGEGTPGAQRSRSKTPIVRGGPGGRSRPVPASVIPHTAILRVLGNRIGASSAPGFQLEPLDVAP